MQVLKAVPLADKGAFVTKISYSPLLGGYAIVLNDGRAAFLVASSNNFDPNVSEGDREINNRFMISIIDGRTRTSQNFCTWPLFSFILLLVMVR